MAVLIPVLERVGRRVLRRTGVSTTHVDTSYGKVHVYDAPGAGELPATVLIHGLGATATPFAPTLGLLRKHVRRVVALDLPGHGFSDHGAGELTPERLFKTVTAVLDTMLDTPAIVVGNSLGGALALHYAAQRPDRVRSLVLVSPAGARGSDEEWSAIRAAFDVTSAASGRAFLERVYHSPPWFVRLLAHELTSTLRTRAVREILASASNDTVPSPETITGLRMPVLFLWGRSERLLPDTHLEYWKQHLPKHAVVERPEGFGHCPHLDAPRALARRIVAFAQSCVAQG